MNSNDIVIERFVFPICSKEQYPILKRTVSDKDKFPETFEEYKKEIIERRKTFFSGANASLVDIDVNEMNKYFEQNNMVNNNRNRQLYAFRLIDGEFNN